MKKKLLSAALAFAMSFPAISYAQAVFYGDAAPNDTSFFTGIEATPIVPNDYNDLLVYPNPVASSTQIVLDVVPGSPVYVDIIDMNGRIDRSFQYSPGTYALDVDMTNLPTGLYSVRVSGRDVRYHNLKVMKE